MKEEEKETIASQSICQDPLLKFKDIMQKLRSDPGQGGALEQIEKMIRESQRKHLHEMFDAVSDADTKGLVSVYKYIPQNGKALPAIIRFLIPSWKGHDKVFWLALGDYIRVSLWSVIDVDYSARGGKIVIKYYDTHATKEKTPEAIALEIAKIVFLIEHEKLSVDFTRFRRMAERRGTIGELPTEVVAILAGLLKVV
jgi:hypothetical protein